MFCRNCGKELTGTPEICVGCGARPLVGSSFCQTCGAETNPLAEICVKCGVIIQRMPSQDARRRLEDDSAMRKILPVGRSGLAIAAGYAGLFAFLVFPAPIALILSILAIYDLKQHPDKLGMGRAVFGLVLGILGTIALLVIAVVAFT